MKLFALLLLAFLANAATWEQLSQYSQRQIELTSSQGVKTRCTLLAVNNDSLSISDNTGQRSVAKADVQEIRLHDPAHKVRRGWLFTAIGAGVGAGLGVAVCPGCANEGNGGKFVGPGVAAGAGLGALSFLASPYRTIYRIK
jgi:hypothetical protein